MLALDTTAAPRTRGCAARQYHDRVDAAQYLAAGLGAPVAEAGLAERPGPGHLHPIERADGLPDSRDGLSGVLSCRPLAPLVGHDWLDRDRWLNHLAVRSDGHAEG